MVLNSILPIPKNMIQDCSSALLIGKDGTCKTSFVFRYCHTIAQKSKDRNVVYISPIKIFKMPLTVEGMSELTTSTAERVIIFYPINLEDLIEYLAKFFTQTQFPSAFIVDDLSFIIKQRRTITEQNYVQIVTRIFALLIDNIEHCKSISGHNCELLVATTFDDKEELEIMRNLGEHFFEKTFFIDECQLLGSTCKGFEIVPRDESFKIVIQVQDDKIKLNQILKKKIKQKECVQLKSDSDLESKF